MTYQPATISHDLNTLPQLPGWVTSCRAETIETVAFRSGAALTVLDQLVSDASYCAPPKLLANRLALTAATATSKLEGRMAREADIRDAWHLTPPGEARGPDGDLLAFWREGVRLRASRTGEIADIVGADFAGEVGGSAPPRSIATVRTPPSYMVAFPPRNGLLLKGVGSGNGVKCRSAPLSDAKSISVFLHMPLRISASVRFLVASSAHVIMP